MAYPVTTLTPIQCIVGTANCTHVKREEPFEDLSEKEHEFDSITVLVLCACLFACLMVGYALHHYKFNYLPHSTASMLIGVVVGGITKLIWLATNDDPDVEKELDFLQFSPEFFFFVLLPPIIFDAGYHFEKKRFFRNFSTITLFALVGTIISAFTVGFIMFGCTKLGIIKNIDGESILESMMFGSLISAVDPVATLSIMGNPELKCDPTLYSIVFGESVLNDAISIVLFSTFKNFIYTEFTPISIAFVFLQFTGIAIGSSLVGVVLGLLCSLLFKKLDLHHLPVYEVLILLLMAFFTYAAIEAMHMSGVMGLFFCGVVLSHYNWYNLSENAKISTKTVFHAIALAMETFVFIYMGLCPWTGEFKTWDPAMMIIAILACLIGRGLNTFGLSALVNIKRKTKLSCKFQFVVWFAGLRGAIAFALALTMPDDGGRWNRDAIVTTTLVVVIFTTVVIGGLTEPVLKKLQVSHDDGSSDKSELFEEGLSYMDFQLQANDGHKPSKKGVHGCWKNFDEKYMKKCFGGPVDHHFAAHQDQERNASSGMASTDGEAGSYEQEMRHTGYTPPPIAPEDGSDNFENIDLADDQELL